MARYVGPCIDCGVDVDRVLRPGRAPRCLDCALEDWANHIRAQRAGTAPSSAKSRASGAATAEALETRTGPRYERWQANMHKAADGNPPRRNHAKR